MKYQKGFTLVELMVAGVILAILVTVSTPSMRSFLARHNLKNTSKLFEQSILLARSEAAQRGSIVRVVPIAIDNNWAEGWQLRFTNEDGDDEIIRAYDPVPDSPNFRSPTFTQGNPLQFRPDGQAIAGGTFTLGYVGCDGGLDYDYQILLSGLLQKTISDCP